MDAQALRDKAANYLRLARGTNDTRAKEAALILAQECADEAAALEAKDQSQKRRS